MKLSDYVFQFIAGQGVKHVFMFPGGGAMHLLDSLGRNKKITYICNHHEQACAIAAEAYARVTNNLGIALVTTGPGGTNSITGVAGAWLDSTPCLFISGQVKRSDLLLDKGVRQLGVQEIDIVSLVKPITKYAITVMEPADIRFHLEKAVYLAKSGRPGPVWIDIPLDIQASDIEVKKLKGFISSDTEQSADKNTLNNQLKEMINLLNEAKRPVILAGNGIRLAGAQKEFIKLMDLLEVPVLTTRLGVDLIPSTHKLYFGMPGSIAARGANFTLQNSDLLIILGARLDYALIAYAPEKLARAAKKIMINIDPAEIRKIKSIIDLPIATDAKDFINGMIDQKDLIKKQDRSSWINKCKEWKTQYPFVLPEHYENKSAVSVYAFSDTLSDLLDKNCVVLPGSSGNACELFLTAFRVKKGQRVFHNKGTGAMGLAQPAAIGACLANRKKLTVCIDGDGGFQLNIQELETVSHLKLPIKFFVMNNGGYASIRAMQKNYFQQLVGADSESGLTLPDITKVAEAYGLNTMRIVDQNDLRNQIKDVLNTPGPVVCEVKIIPDEIRKPRVSSMQRPDGSMVSKPLEDMWPFLDRAEFSANMIIKPLKED